jgi:hypothetical protein
MITEEADAPMKGIESVLGAAPGLVGAARADAAGNVHEMTGPIDGESLGAVAAMTKAPLEKAAEILGLGALRDFSFSYMQGALYVHHGEEMLVVQGGPTKSPETTMKKLSQLAGER